MDHPRVHHAHHPTRTLWTQKMGADCTENVGKKLAPSSGEILQYYQPWHRQEPVDSIIIIAVAGRSEVAQLLLEVNCEDSLLLE